MRLFKGWRAYTPTPRRIINNEKWGGGSRYIWPLPPTLHYKQSKYVYWHIIHTLLVHTHTCSTFNLFAIYFCHHVLVVLRAQQKLKKVKSKNLPSMSIKEREKRRKQKKHPEIRPQIGSLAPLEILPLVL